MKKKWINEKVKMLIIRCGSSFHDFGKTLFLPKVHMITAIYVTQWFDQINKKRFYNCQTNQNFDYDQHFNFDYVSLLIFYWYS